MSSNSISSDSITTQIVVFLPYGIEWQLFDYDGQQQNGKLFDQKGSCQFATSLH